MVTFALGIALLIIGVEITQESKNFQVLTWNIIFSIGGYIGMVFLFASVSAMLVIQKRCRTVRSEILSFARLCDDKREFAR